MERRADVAYVRRLAHDTLQRSPTQRETRSSVGMPLEAVARHFVRLRETYEQWLEEELYYYLLLDRFRPRTDAIAELPEQLRRGRADVRSAAAEILLSTGFSLRNPGNDTFVTVVLEQCLGMEVQARANQRTLDAGKKMYDGEKVKLLDGEGSSQSDFVRLVIAHRDFAAHLLDRHHQRLFGEGLPRSGKRLTQDAETSVDRVHATPSEFFTVLQEWLASERYADACAVRRPRTDRQFVRSLYTDLLERQPDYDEMRNMRNALQSMADSTPLRGVLVKVVLDSGKAALPPLVAGEEDAFVRECFERYLGRSPGQDESTAFAKALREPETRSAHVVRTLLSSPEYQFY